MEGNLVECSGDAIADDAPAVLMNGIVGRITMKVVSPKNDTNLLVHETLDRRSHQDRLANASAGKNVRGCRQVDVEHNQVIAVVNHRKMIGPGGIVNIRECCC